MSVRSGSIVAGLLCLFAFVALSGCGRKDDWPEGLPPEPEPAAVSEAPDDSQPMEVASDTQEEPRSALAETVTETVPEREPDDPRVDEILAVEPVFPARVVYKKAVAAVNRAAVKKLIEAFAPDAPIELREELCTNTLICGPGMWHDVGEEAEMAKIETGNTTFRIPQESGDLELDGKLFQNRGEIAAFWEAFARRFKQDAAVTVRRPTSDEFELYWAMIPYDITEPIFMVEGPEFKILAAMGAEDSKLLWIDDYREIRVESIKDEQR